MAQESSTPSNPAQYWPYSFSQEKARANGVDTRLLLDAKRAHESFEGFLLCLIQEIQDENLLLLVGEMLAKMYFSKQSAEEKFAKFLNKEDAQAEKIPLDAKANSSDTVEANIESQETALNDLLFYAKAICDIIVLSDESHPFFAALRRTNLSESTQERFGAANRAFEALQTRRNELYIEEDVTEEKFFLFLQTTHHLLSQRAKSDEKEFWPYRHFTPEQLRAKKIDPGLFMEAWKANDLLTQFFTVLAADAKDKAPQLSAKLLDALGSMQTNFDVYYRQLFLVLTRSDDHIYKAATVKYERQASHSKEREKMIVDYITNETYECLFLASVTIKILMDTTFSADETGANPASFLELIKLHAPYSFRDSHIRLLEAYNAFIEVYDAFLEKCDEEEGSEGDKERSEGEEEGSEGEEDNAMHAQLFQDLREIMQAITIEVPRSELPAHIIAWNEGLTL